jgi:adenylate cyclase
LEISLLSWLVVVFLGIVFSGSRLNMENRLIDARMHLPHGVRPSTQIVYVDIDDPSIELLGRMPWSYSQWAEVVRILSRPAISGLFLDVLLPDETVPEEDLALAGALEECNNVFLGAGVQPEQHAKSPVQDQQMQSILMGFTYDIDVEENSRALRGTRTIAPIPVLIGVAEGIGHISFVPDEDGVARHMPLLIDLYGRYFPSIDVEIARKFLDVEKENVEVVPGKYLLLKGARPPDLEERVDIAIPVDSQMRLLINYAGPWRSAFNHYSLHGILRDLLADDKSTRQEAEDLLADKFVVLSAAYSGATDIGPTPFEPLMPLSEIHAHVISSIVNQEFLRKVPTAASMGIALVVCLFLGLISPRMKTLNFSTVSALAVALWIACTLILFSAGNLVVDIIWPCGAIIISYGGCAGYLHLKTERERAALRKAFSNYVSPEILSRMLEDPDKLKLGGERLNLSILVLVLENFERFSDNVEPEEVIDLLTAVYEEACEAILEHGGTVDKFTKDGLIAFFGAPIEQDSHPESAARAALSIRVSLADHFASISRRRQKSVGVKMAINVGFATVGNIGSSKRMDYTVIGKNVNLCVRMAQSATEGQIIIPAKGLDGLEDIVEVEDCGEVRFDPYPKPFHVSNILGLKDATGQIPVIPIKRAEAMHDKKFLGPYRLIEKIGAGNMGTVYKGYDDQLDREVAIKVLFPSVRKDIIKTIAEEAKVLAKLNHSNIVQIYSAGEEDDIGFLAMEFVDGVNLRELINTEGALSVGDALDSIIQTSRGLNAAHKQGIVHRDIKPANLLTNTHDVVKITDFGLAVEAVLGQDEDGRIAGTFQYVSPEQSQGKKVDSRSDIYSLGITFYHLLAGVPPFNADSIAGLAWHHADSELPIGPLEAKGIPDSLITVIQKMTAKSPQERYSDYLELLNDLDKMEAEISA